jgi:hypothetical protein
LVTELKTSVLTSNLSIRESRLPADREPNT